MWQSSENKELTLKPGSLYYVRELRSPWEKMEQTDDLILLWCKAVSEIYAVLSHELLEDHTPLMPLPVLGESPCSS